jgi:ribosomal protein S12 methylthiotransferase accessory factor
MPWISDPFPPEELAGEVDYVPQNMLSVADYWQRLRPRLSQFGISRVADITGLDRIGLPVVQAVRPGARSNVVTQGKAMTPEGAAVGAVLECLEMAAGEDLTRFDPVPAGEAALWAPLAPGLPDGINWPDHSTDYIAAYDISNDARISLPRDLISTDFARGADAERAPILRHSIGLGAGTNLGVAMMHGLMEAIEADARLRAEASGREQRLALDQADPDYGPLLHLLAAVGIEAIAYTQPCKGGLFAIKASVIERKGPVSLPLPATGYAARPKQSSAIFAALAEAIQARLAVISGAREDISQRFYAHGFTPADLGAEWQRQTQLATIQTDASVSTPTVRQLAAQIGPVFAVALHWDPDLPLAITRIIAPTLITDPLRLVSP